MGDDASATASPALSDVLDRRAIALAEAYPDREAAVRRCGDLLVAGGRVDPAYTDEMLAVLAQYGPYIVLAPGIALAHARPSPAVRDVAFSLLTVDPPIAFGHPENDPVTLVIGMAAPNDEAHVDALRQLAELLADDARRTRLLGASSVDEVMEIVARPDPGESRGQS
ncbi:MAG: PTS sugar transporter subunit IIA [Candidatus Limnocylindria bacterium]